MQDSITVYITGNNSHTTTIVTAHIVRLIPEGEWTHIVLTNNERVGAHHTVPEIKVLMGTNN